MDTFARVDGPVSATISQAPHFRTWPNCLRILFVVMARLRYLIYTSRFVDGVICALPVTMYCITTARTGNKRSILKATQHRAARI